MCSDSGATYKWNRITNGNWEFPDHIPVLNFYYLSGEQHTYIKTYITPKPIIMKYRRSLIVIAVSIEIAALVLWLTGDPGYILHFVLITSSMLLLQLMLMISSEFRLWKRS